MKTLVLIFTLLMGFSAQANTTCLSEDQAREQLLLKESTVLKALHQKAGVRICRGTPNQGCITKTHFVKAILASTWNEYHQAFVSNTLYGWDCAAGASCWLQAGISCQGDVRLVETGD